MTRARGWTCAAAAALALSAAASPARAQRPVLAGEETFGVPGGAVLVHYATTGADAVPAADANGDGVPDFVAEVAAVAEDAVARFAALGFRAPLGDGALGGDGRIDVYLRDLVSADGRAVVDACERGRCAGHVIAENDYRGYAYPSIGEAIRSVVPHELFHLVQYAYAGGQPGNWTEGSAVWAVEHLYGDGNADFERFLPAFLTRTYRPFERPSGGFGDAFPYGAALWPYFLEHRFGAGAIVAAWEESAHAPFLDAVDAALAPRGATVDDAWIEFTRWNAYTGPRAAARGNYPDARAWPEAPREAAVDGIEGGGTLYLEGLSARYVPIVLAARARVARASAGLRVAARAFRDGDGDGDGDGVDGGVELAGDGAALAAELDAGAYLLVATGLSRGKITTAVELAIAPPPDGDEGDSGCAAAPGASLAWLVLAVPRRRRRRRGGDRAMVRACHRSWSSWPRSACGAAACCSSTPRSGRCAPSTAARAA